MFPHYRMLEKETLPERLNKLDLKKAITKRSWREKTYLNCRNFSDNLSNAALNAVSSFCSCLAKKANRTPIMFEEEATRTQYSALICSNIMREISLFLS